MARPRKQHNAPETRDEILKAARIEFSLQGMAAPLDAIAARCGIRRPSLLHHFPSKQALIAAVMEDILNKTRSRLLDSLSQTRGGQRDTLARILKVLRELEDEEKGVGAMLMHAMLAESESGPVTKNLAEFIDLIYTSAVMAGYQVDQDPDEVRAALAHLVMGEVARVALGDRATALWGRADGVNPLFESYFLKDSH